MQKEINKWEVLKSFTIAFKGEKIAIDLVRLQPLDMPEFYFFVTMERGKMLLNKTVFRDKIMWIGGSIVSHEEAQELGAEIERQLGNTLPVRESNNPFEYTGEIDIRIIRFMLGNIPVEKAKAPYSRDMWYKVFLPNTTVVLAKMYLREMGCSWVLEEPSSLIQEHFQLVTDLIDKSEKNKEDSP